MTPACAQACPTQSIRFGPINELKKEADTRLGQLHQLGMAKAELYGADDKVLGGLNAFYLLPDKPEVFGLPADPKLPSRTVQRSAFWAIFTSFMTAMGVLFAFRNRTKGQPKPTNSPTSKTVDDAVKPHLIRWGQVAIGSAEGKDTAQEGRQAMNFWVADPEWGWWIILYFFLGGLSAGSYFIATLIELFGTEEDRRLAAHRLLGGLSVDHSVRPVPDC